MTYVSAAGKHLASMNAAFGVVDAADVEIVREHQAVHPADSPADLAAEPGNRALPYLPGKKLVLDRATKGVRQAVNAIALEQSPG